MFKERADAQAPELSCLILHLTSAARGRKEALSAINSVPVARYLIFKIVPS